VLALAVLAVLVAAVLAALAAPRPFELGARTSGDTDLAERVRERIDDPTGYYGLSVALVEPGPDGEPRIRVAGLGSEGEGEAVRADTPFGSASVAKVLPGMLLADMVERGEVALDTEVGALLPDLDFADPEVAGLTVEELATHTSGLSREETSLPQTLWQFAAKRHPEPYGSVDEFLRSVAADARVDPRTRGTNAYSNTGINLLGHALAARAGVPYDELVRERILDPLGMADSAIWTAEGGRAPLVHDADRGRPLAVDRSAAGGPAGGLVTTAPDLALLVAGMMDGTAPGAASAEPRGPGDVERREQGLGWYVETLGGQDVTGHGGNATTNGHTAWIGYTGERGAVVLSNTHRFSEDIGLRLVGIDEPSPDNAAGESVYAVATAVLALVPGLFALGFAARRRPGRWWRRPTDRIGLVSYGLAGTAVLWYAHLAGFWHLVTPWAWTSGVLLLACAAAVGVLRWPDLPTARGRRAWARWLRVAPPMAASCAVLVVLALL
jgi:CubicO group peptidase (beta-lactamase class C family)